jgi:hypothetical protein
MASNWFIAYKGQKIGPFTLYQVRQLAAFHLVLPTDHVLEEGAARWVPAASLTWLNFAPVHQNFYVYASGHAHGPYDAEQIRAALMAGKIPPETLVCPQLEKEQWCQVQFLPEFQSSLPTMLDMPRKTGKRGVKSLSKEEAELHLAGKRGDSLARLISSLLEMRRTHVGNENLLEIIDKNIQALKEKRAQGSVLV